MCFIKNRAGETVPGRCAAGDQMMRADERFALRTIRRQPAIQRGERAVHDQPGIGRCAVLVGNHAQFVALGAEAQHGAQEIVTVRRVDPRGAEDEMVGTAVAQRLFAGQLAAAVGAERAGGRVGGVRLRLPAVEHVVGGIVDHQRAVHRRPAAQHADRLAVDAGGQCLLLLGTIDRGVRGGVDDHVRLYAVEQGGQRCGDRKVGDLALAALRQRTITAGRDQFATRGQTALVEEGTAQLAVGAEQQDPHGA